MKADTSRQMATVAEYARHRGVSRAAIYKAAKAGRISWRRGAGLIDVELTDREWDARTDPSQGKPTPTPIGGDEDGAAVDALAAARTRKMEADANLADLKLQKLRGELVGAREVADLVSAAFTVVQQRVLGVPGRVRGRLVGLDDELEVETVLEDELRDALDAAAAAIDALELPATEGGDE